MENNKLPTEQESVENFTKWNNDLETRYITGCDPYEKDDSSSITTMKVTDGICEMINQYRKNLDFLEKMARIACGIPNKL